MPTSELRFRRRLVYIAAALSFLAALAACEDDPTPPALPAAITILSGDAQYTKKGTTLEDPVLVRVTDDKGAPASHMTVHFSVIEGGGSVSRSTATTNTEGRASVVWTMGPATGANRLRATVSENSALAVVATATSSDYYCPEEDPTFSAKFTGTGDIVMLTHASTFSDDADLVHYDINGGTHKFAGDLLETYPDGVGQVVVRDCVFSANGDLFVSWANGFNQVVKVATNGTVTHFATLEPPPFGTIQQGAELAMTPNGVLVGCDVVGPFYVTCRDTVFRFEDAIYSGDDFTRDQANNDAVACDPNSGDVYFIYKADRDLFRIPFDGVTAGSKTKVADLPSIDVSDDAKGMVVDGSDGSVYIVVDSANTKSIVRITSAGVVSTAFDFTTRPDAGVQNDLAIDRSLKYLFTLDTKNNVFLAFGLPTSADPGSLVTFTATTDPGQASDASSGERVGLDVIPAAGP
jgi:hypothetical protein